MSGEERETSRLLSSIKHLEGLRGDFSQNQHLAEQLEQSIATLRSTLDIHNRLGEGREHRRWSGRPRRR